MNLRVAGSNCEILDIKVHFDLPNWVTGDESRDNYDHICTREASALSPLSLLAIILSMSTHNIRRLCLQVCAASSHVETIVRYNELYLSALDHWGPSQRYQTILGSLITSLISYQADTIPLLIIQPRTLPSNIGRNAFDYGAYQNLLGAANELSNLHSVLEACHAAATYRAPFSPFGSSIGSVGIPIGPALESLRHINGYLQRHREGDGVNFGWRRLQEDFMEDSA